VNLLFDPGAGRILEGEATLLDVVADGVAADPRVTEVLRPHREAVGEIMDEELGQAGVDLDYDIGAECRIGNLLTDAIREQHGVDIVLQNSLGVRAPIARGPVRYEDVFKALPFENTVVLMSLKGSEVAEVLAQADANNRFFYTSGLRYAFHPARPEGERIEILSDLEPDRNYRVAVNSFLAQGGDGMSRLVEIGGDRDTGVVLRDVLAERFRRDASAGRTVEAALDGRIEIVEAQDVSIMEIQGRDTFSPLAGRAVATTGVVTQLARFSDGFWLQDAAGDGDAATSDGVYVSLDGADPALAPRPGDLVRIVAEVEEEQSKKALPHTRLVKPSAIEVLESGRALPEPVPLVDLPNLELADAVAFWEPLEGMRVRVTGGTVVGPTEISGMFVLLADADAVPGSGYFPGNHHLLPRSLGGDRVDYNPERIIVESRDNPSLRPGDEIQELTGAVVYASGIYMIRPDTIRAVSRELPRPPLSRRDSDAGDFTVTCYNLRDLFDVIDDPVMLDERFTPTPDDLNIQLTKLAMSIDVELELPEILVVNEFESPGILQTLGDRVNALAGTRYRSASLETSDWRGLEAGFLYDEDRVDLVDYYQLSGDDVEQAFGEGIFRTREPLVGVFRFQDSGKPLYIFANKFKTKRGEDPRMSLNEKPVRRTEAQRKVQAKVVRSRVNAMLEKDPDALVLVTGDLGDFQFPEPGELGEDPIGTLEGRGDEVRLTNLIDLESEGERFTYIFQGNSMAFTHMLVSPALLELLAGTDVLHFNAGLPDRLQHDRRTPFRASDRDPVEGRFYFPHRAAEPE
ncbi:MAG: 5'-nucleotidase C-terminal domain-containing protein, partial [Acidobacteriota bacterium]